jgi:hypothetical protein
MRRIGAIGGPLALDAGRRDALDECASGEKKTTMTGRTTVVLDAINGPNWLAYSPRKNVSPSDSGSVSASLRLVQGPQESFHEARNWSNATAASTSLVNGLMIGR